MCNELVAGLDQDRLREFIQSPRFNDFSKSSDCSRLELLRIVFPDVEGTMLSIVVVTVWTYNIIRRNN